jgi:hypothetical protein
MQTFIRYRCPDNTPPLPEFRQTERKEEKEARRDAGAQEQTEQIKNSKKQYPIPRRKRKKERDNPAVPIWPQFVGSGEHKTHSFQRSRGKIKRPIRRAKT